MEWVMDAEEWRIASGYEGRYEVSSWGRVRSVERVHPMTTGVLTQKILKQYQLPKGYMQLEMTDVNGRRRMRRVHQVVAEAFLGPRPLGMVVCHNDGDPANNRADNLRWDTMRANVQDTLKQGRHRQLAKTHCPKMHPYDEQNTYFTPKGHRRCRTCARERRGE